MGNGRIRPRSLPFCLRLASLDVLTCPCTRHAHVSSELIYLVVCRLQDMVAYHCLSVRRRIIRMLVQIQYYSTYLEACLQHAIYHVIIQHVKRVELCHVCFVLLVLGGDGKGTWAFYKRYRIPRYLTSWLTTIGLICLFLIMQTATKVCSISHA